MKTGDYVKTPRFCKGEYDILGKHTGTNRMIFAAIQKPTCNCNCIDCNLYYSCTSELKIDENTREFWLSERE
ncbi:MAG: hypothetical protein GX796_04285 [Clostridiaceae bacterium]|nr:hypothetical protein [Clostridiaceae bacterium]